MEAENARASIAGANERVRKRPEVLGPPYLAYPRKKYGELYRLSQS
jgi:hypothetical protein